MTSRPALIAALLTVTCAVSAPTTARAGKPSPAAATRADSTNGSAAVRGNPTPGAPVVGATAPKRTSTRSAAGVTTSRASRASAAGASGPGSSGAPASVIAPSGTAIATARNRSAASARTLEDIHIEGEIPVPQVLFITARDQRRFVGFHHRRYLRTSRKIGEDTAVPSRITVTGAATLPERSHSDE